MSTPSLFPELPGEDSDQLELGGDRPWSYSTVQRQAEAIRAGYHPLGPRLHLDVATAVVQHPGGELQVSVAAGPRFGSCAHRLSTTHHSRTYAKCVHPVTHGLATDARGWWPACVHHEPTTEP